MDINVTNTTPVTATLVLDAKEKRALIDAAREASELSGSIVTPVELFKTGVRSYIKAMVRRYEERTTNDMLEKFNAATPEQQAAAIAAVGGTLPT